MKNRKGFTIVELVIVIAVIAILAAVLIPTFSGIISKANKSAAIQNARTSLQNVLAGNIKDGGTIDKAVFISDATYEVLYDNGQLKSDNEEVKNIGTSKDELKTDADTNTEGTQSAYTIIVKDSTALTAAAVKDEILKALGFTATATTYTFAPTWNDANTTATLSVGETGSEITFTVIVNPDFAAKTVVFIK